MKIDVDLPKFDIPKDFIVGDGITGDILNMYGLFPCKIKAGVFAFCTRGTIRVTINLDEHTARANDFITLLPKMRKSVSSLFLPVFWKASILSGRSPT